jgi:elongation of very long chain fatty acids protein 6
LKALKFHVPRQVAMVITAAQLMQMVVGCHVNVSAYNALERGEKCQVTVENIKISLLMYASYFVLFSRFFYKAYLDKGSSSSKEVKNKDD